MSPCYFCQTSRALEAGGRKNGWGDGLAAAAAAAAA